MRKIVHFLPLFIAILDTLGFAEEKDLYVDRDPNKTFPEDCSPLSGEDVAAAEQLLPMLDGEFTTEAEEILKEMVIKDDIKAYAWWRWIQEKLLSLPENKSQIRKKLASVTPLHKCVEYDKRGVLISFSWYYFLKDGRAIPNGPFYSRSDMTGEIIAGQFKHGAQDGRWTKFLISNQKKVVEEIWKEGKPITGTFLLLMKDGGLGNFKLLDGNEVEPRKDRVFEYKRRVIIQNSPVPNSSPVPNAPDSAAGTAEKKNP